MKKEENKEIEIIQSEKANNMDVDNNKSVKNKENVNYIKKGEANSILNHKRKRKEEESKPKRKYQKKSKEERKKVKEKHAFYIKEAEKKGKRIFGCELCKVYFKTKKQFKKKKSIKQNPMMFHSIKDLKFHFKNFHLEQPLEKVSDYTKNQLVFSNSLNQEIAILKKDYLEKSKENVNFTRGYSEMIRCKKCGFRDTHDKMREHKYLICNRLPRRYKDLKQKCMKHYLKDIYSTIDRFELTEISEIKMTL